MPYANFTTIAMVFYKRPSMAKPRNFGGVDVAVVGGRGLHSYICPTFLLVSSLPPGQGSEKDRACHAYVGYFSIV